MPGNDVEVVVVGGGSAGIAAGRRLRDAAIDCLVVEARDRLGGRAWTVTDPSGYAIDLGCGWLHSADRNPWAAVAQEQGASVDKSRPPWMSPSPEIGFPRAQQNDFQKAMAAFFARLEKAGESASDVPASAYLDPASPWNGLITAIGTYISGAEFDRVSAKDLQRYEEADSGVNWRVVEGLGSVISAYGANLPLVLDCPVSAIDHRGKRLRIETAKGVISADQVIVTIPTPLIAAERIAFTPALRQKTEAALGLPLGLADKLFMSLDHAEEFANGTRIFGRTDRAATGAYQFRPLGRPMIEAYFGGACAAQLEAHGDGAFFDFAVSELTGLFGGDFARRLKPVRIHHWGEDPFALGSYSFALPGCADFRRTLAAAVDDRLFFAGEACSIGDYSTAHGGFLTGVAAADAVIAVRKKALNLAST